MTEPQVRRILGDPFEVDTDGSVVRWRYFVTSRQDEYVYVLGFIETRKQMYRGTSETRIEFRDGRVDKIESEERPPDS